MREEYRVEVDVEREGKVASHRSRRSMGKKSGQEEEVHAKKLDAVERELWFAILRKSW